MEKNKSFYMTLVVLVCSLFAFLGAFYLDGNQKEIIDFLNEIFEDYILDIKNNMVKYNAKEVLQEYTQSKTKEVPQYKLIEEIGPAWTKIQNGSTLPKPSFGNSNWDKQKRCGTKMCLRSL